MRFADSSQESRLGDRNLQEWNVGLVGTRIMSGLHSRPTYKWGQDEITLADGRFPFFPLHSFAYVTGYNHVAQIHFISHTRTSNTVPGIPINTCLGKGGQLP